MAKRRFIVKNARKKRMYLSLLLAFIILFGIGFANIAADIDILGILGINKYERTLYGVFINYHKAGVFVQEYDGVHQDTLDNHGHEKIYLWLPESLEAGSTIQDKNNVIFGGFCWQMFRSTDTGGVRLVYNGEPVNNQCLNTRSNHFGYGVGVSQNLTNSYYYGTNYTYDSNTGLYSLDGWVEAETWSETTGRSLTGKYTCLETTASATCSTLYLVADYQTNTNGYLLPIVSNTHYSQIGVSNYNVIHNSPAQVGYMYNPDTLVSYKGDTAPTSGSLFGKGVTYLNGTYTLTDTSTTYDSTHHYTCNNTTGTCSTVRYYYYGNYYTELSDGRNIEEAVEEMLSSDNVNQVNSTIKTAIDAWYKKYMLPYSSYLEDTIFCNDRGIKSLGGWNPNGGGIAAEEANYLQFSDYLWEEAPLNCANVTDQFSVSNSKARLLYNVGLMTNAEAALMAYPTVRVTGNAYWLLSPHAFRDIVAAERAVNADGTAGYSASYGDHGIRPVISLASNIKYNAGNGSMLTPYIMDAEPAANTYILTYNSEGGSFCPYKEVTPNATWGELCTPTREGYTFNGWNTKVNGNGTTITSSSQATSDVVVYAQWLKKYNITYQLNGGTNNSNNPSFYTKDNTITIANPTKSGYTFAGWSGSNDYSSGLENYTTTTPYVCGARDHHTGTSFAVSEGEVYRVFITAKRTAGTLDMNGGLFYTELSGGYGYDGYGGAFTKLEDVGSGWAKYYKDVTVPANKTKAHFYIQLNQTSPNFYTSWSVADIHIVKVGETTTIPQGSTDDKNYIANWFDNTNPVVVSATASSTLDLSNYIDFNATDVGSGIVGYNVTTSNTAPTTWIPVVDAVSSMVETKYDKNISWARVFHHNNHWSGVIFSNATEAQSSSTNDKYSVLGSLDNYKGPSNWELLLEYPDYSTTGYNHWTQTENPATATVADGDGTANAPGYTAVHIDWTSSYWGGLAKSTSASTFINGSVGHGNWFYAVGSYANWQGGIPGPGVAISTTNLWARIDTLAKTTSTNLTRRIGGIKTNGTYYVWVKDSLGNTASKTVTISKVDTTPPTISSVTLSNGTTISATIGDNQAIDKYYIGSTNPASNNVTYTSVSGTVTSQSVSATISATGTYYIAVVDKAGNRTITNKDLTNTVGFNVNGGGGSGYQTANVTASYGSAMPTISTTKPTKTGYNFGGWYDTSAASGGTQYYTAAGASARTWNKTANTTLYARWTPVTNTVSFNVNGGGGSGYQTANVTATYAANMPTISTTKPTRAGYTFGGWYDTSAATGGTQYYTAAGASARTWNKTANTTLYARWIANTYTVSFNVNGGGGSGYQTANVTATYDAAMPIISTTKPTRTGYNFGGWYDTSAASGGTQYYTAAGASARTWNKTANTTLYARWTPITNTVSFNVNGGGGSGYQTANVTATYAANMPTISTTKPTRTGYNFGGWYDTSAATGGTQYYTAAGASARTWNKTANTILYARWTAIQSTVTLDKQSGTGGTASVTATYGSAMPSATAPTRSGYTFGGYYTGTKGSGTQYYNASMGSVRNWDKTSATTLYAKWSSPLNVGDYFTLIPDKSTFSITSDMTGRDETQTINPSQLTLWRVISLDGGIVAVSEYVSSQSVCIYGKKGFANLVGTLQTVAAQYSKSGYTIATRMMGYNGQTLITQLPSDNYSSTCSGDISTTPSTTTGTGREYNSGLGGDTLYLKDYQLVSNLYKSDTATYGRFGLNAYIVGTSTKQKYWLASRVISGGSSYDNSVLVGKSKNYAGRVVTTSDSNNISLSIVLAQSSVSTYDCFRNKATEGSACASVRPIITLSSSVSAVDGSGTKSNPYTITN